VKRSIIGLVVIFALGILGASLTADAQQPRKIPRIGFLDPSPPSSPYYEGFREGLRELGYVEAQTIALEPRFAEGHPERLADLAAELVRLNVDVITALGGGSIQAARSVTTTIPIVMGYSGDSVEAGFVASLARPGGNITGVSFFSSELAGKRLELLKAVVPEVSRVAVLSNPAHPGEHIDWREVQGAARRLSVTLHYVTVRGPHDFDDALVQITAARAEGLFVIPDALTMAHRGKVAEFAVKTRLPMMAAWSAFTKAGGLMSYGPNLRDSFRHAAVFVDKILKGRKPAELPVEQPTKFELVINLKTAQALGLTIPPTLLFQADEIIR
jgi:putative tryptophan/tyrosine transport system substrate-binding protein